MSDSRKQRLIYFLDLVAQIIKAGIKVANKTIQSGRNNPSLAFIEDIMKISINDSPEIPTRIEIIFVVVISKALNLKLS